MGYFVLAVAAAKNEPPHNSIPSATFLAIVIEPDDAYPNFF